MVEYKTTAFEEISYPEIYNLKVTSELQISGHIEDKSNIIFLISHVFLMYVVDVCCTPH